MLNIQHITIAGKAYPCRTTMGALLRFKRETGREVAEIQNGELTDLLIFLWCCVVSACRADGKDFDMSLEDFADQCDLKAFNEWTKAINNNPDQEKKTETTAAQ